MIICEVLSAGTYSWALAKFGGYGGAVAKHCGHPSWLLFPVNMLLRRALRAFTPHTPQACDQSHPKIFLETGKYTVWVLERTSTLNGLCEQSAQWS